MMLIYNKCKISLMQILVKFANILYRQLYFLKLQHNENSAPDTDSLKFANSTTITRQTLASVVINASQTH